MHAGQNEYGYVGGAPTMWRDALGLLPGAPDPRTCLENGQSCSDRAQKGIYECIKGRGELSAGICGQEWHTWAEGCFSSGAPACDDKNGDPNGTPNPNGNPSIDLNIPDSNNGAVLDIPPSDPCDKPKIVLL